MTYIVKPRLHHPKLPINALGYTHRDYEGSISTLCAGCGHDSISAAIIQSCFELALPPHRIAKLSGIGCSSKTPTYFLGQSHGFNSVHGRMPSVLTGPRRAFEPLSAVAENWPLVRPYTPLFSTMYTMSTPRRMQWANWPRPIEAESPSPETPR